MTPRFIELHARSAFSFLRAASQPERLVEQAAALELPALAVTDRDGVYGSARVHLAAKEHGVRAITGAELTLDDGSVLPVLVATRAGYRNLCQLITRAKLRAGSAAVPVRPSHDARSAHSEAVRSKDGAPGERPAKAGTPVRWEELAQFSEGLVALTGDEEGPVQRCLATDDRAGAMERVEKLRAAFGEENVFVEIQRHLRRGEDTINDALADLAAATRLPLLATNGVLHATREERTVLDVFTCARHHTHLDAAGRWLAVNDERHLKSAPQMERLFRDRPEALANTVRLAERLAFTLADLGYEFPRYAGMSDAEMSACLRRATLDGARRRYGTLDARTTAQLERELGLIIRLGFAGYFLIVWDLVNFCTAQGILVQGRGSAANSVVCYSLGITACDPIGYHLLFERFLSEGRKTWPDIDLDLPSGDRRERVIQEVYRRYGKDGAAMTANVITFRGRSAMREIGKALNFPLEVLNRFSHLFGHGDFQHTLELEAQVRQAGLPLEQPRTRAAIALYQRIYGLPRHLGQHSGGMIICQGQLSSVVPLENAAMPGRVVAQWDKDDCADLGIIKVDLLGLGMMAAMQDVLEMCRQRRSATGVPPGTARDFESLERCATTTCADLLAAIPQDDPATYDLLCAADTVGTFQVESRAQMATLPRMQPRCFYDVVVEVAIIRPGPIQGNMLHPYLARRAGREPVSYFGRDDLLKPVLGRTLGVPLFQEQLLKMAMVMADFSGAEAEELRRALSFHRSQEKMNKVCVKLRAGMARKGVESETIEQITQAVQSFAVYGFPESHAISFALIAYASCWMKVHRAPEFYAALLNNQPMGFYSPASLVVDAKRHGVPVRAVSVIESAWRCTIEDETQALRLGLCQVRGLAQADGERIVAERKRAPFSSLADLQLRTQLPKSTMRTLAKIGALNGLADHRRDAQWKVEVAREADDLFALAESSAALPLAPMQPVERTRADFSGTGLTTGPHPMAYLRARLPDMWRAADLPQARTGTLVRIAGQVICRQRPGTAKGFVFISLEDETGTANAIVVPQLFEERRLIITEEPFLVIEGVVQNLDRVIHVKARTIEPLTARELPAAASHDFH
jgi:error-prone DNA polymerase